MITGFFGGGDGEIRTLASVWADLPHFECGPFNRLGTSPNLCYIPGPDPPTNSAGGNREEQQDRTSNIIQFELGWNPHGSKGFSRLALRIGNLISNPDPSTTWVHLRIPLEPHNFITFPRHLQPFPAKIRPRFCRTTIHLGQLNKKGMRKGSFQ